MRTSRLKQICHRYMKPKGSQHRAGIPTAESQGNQTWEENGVHWSVAPDSLSYYDDTTQSWILFQN